MISNHIIQESGVVPNDFFGSSAWGATGIPGTTNDSVGYDLEPLSTGGQGTVRRATASALQLIFNRRFLHLIQCFLWFMFDVSAKSSNCGALASPLSSKRQEEHTHTVGDSGQ